MIISEDVKTKYISGYYNTEDVEYFKSMFSRSLRVPKDRV